MAREADVVRSLVEMADTLVDDFDVVDLLTGLTDRCVRLLGVSAAGVMLASPAGRLGLVASSSEAMRLLELFELQAQEGPCLDAFRTGERVGPEKLQAGSGRWPSFSAAALEAGFQAASALPLRLRDTTLGAMNLLSAAAAPVAEAFSRLRAYARNHNRRLTDVAQAAIDGTLDPQAWAPPAPQRPARRPGGPACGEG